MKKGFFVKEDMIGEKEIYFEGRLLDGYTDVLNTILDNKDIEFYFKGFSKEELRLFKSIIKAYKNKKIDYMNSNLTIITHSLKYKDTKYYYLDRMNVGNKILKDFTSIEKIDIKKLQNKYIVIVAGTVYLYGVKNELGFYDVENDNFIFDDDLENTKRIVIEELRNHDALHYVRKRTR